ncbi:hypothetical protein [Virgisporangium aurantiacum]|uniref:Uncharacterized protein n=1 Tax=Virgisporangium aurantiacum TaxID=175570 RepID=A0A8J4E7B9_9ACTN|nr:hypothetical protein [Virgisporangium aurantiacum]GIJ64033.1 hypothetical protein Vau01_115490 [Virgisporangium aurantiacum]
MNGTDYPHLRDALDDRFSALTDAELDSVFESAFGEGVTPAEYEEFFSGLGKAFSNIGGDIGRFAQQAAPVVASAAQGAMQGAAAGSRLGPYGALFGALAGGTGSALKSHGTGAARDVGNVITGVVGTAGALTGGGGTGPGLAGLLGGGGAGRAPATSQLLGLLARPETAQALAALVGGRNPAVPAGPSGVPVPANAFAGLLSALARESEAEALSWGDAVAVPAYLVGPRGDLVADPADPDQCSGRLLQLLGPPTREQDEAYDEAYDEYEEYDEFVARGR